jgi:hypothetical protein
VKVTVTTNWPKERRRLTDLERRQMPFAMAMALTATAKDAGPAQGRAMKMRLDKPTPFTRKGVGFEKATKQTLTATVKVKPIQAQYLQYAIYGGTRFPMRRALLMPVNVGLNKYGNLPRRKVQTLLARKDTFSGVVKGVAGIWQRTGKSGRRARGNSQGRASGARIGTVKLLLRYETSARYRKRYDFAGVGQRHADGVFPAQFDKAFERALRTAR